MTSDLLPEYEYALEALLHLRCTACGGWWTLSDGLIDREYFCPYCGRPLAPAQYDEIPRPPSNPPKELPL